MNTDNYTWFFSSGVSNSNRDKVEKIRTNNGRVPIELRDAINEHRGVGFAIYNGFAGTIEKVEALGARLMYIKLNSASNCHIIVAYAPTAEAPRFEKEEFYYQVGELIKKVPKHEFLLINGDFNAKLIKLDENETDRFGKHYLEAENGVIERTHVDTLDNRTRFMDFVNDNDLCIQNTKFEKSTRQLCSRKQMATVRDEIEENWNYGRFDQLDFVLTRNRWKNACLD